MKPASSTRAKFMVIGLMVAFNAVGCSGNAVTPAPPATSNTPPQTTATPTRPSPTPVRLQVGSIDNVSNRIAYVDQAEAHESAPIYAQSSVRTDGSGAVEFDIPSRIKSCTVTPSSEVEVEPSGDTVLKFKAGLTSCATVKTDHVIHLAAGEQIELSMSDPLFVVSVTPETTSILVVSGVVEVRNIATVSRTPVVLLPSFKAVVALDTDPNPPSRWDRSELPQAALDAIDRQTLIALPPAFGRPDPTGSPVLQAIFDRGSFLIGIDERVAADPASLAFVESFRGFQASHWGLGADSLRFTFDEGVRELAAGKIALFVSPDAPSGGSTRIPFFASPGGGPSPNFLLTRPDDDVFVLAERQLVRNLVSDAGTENYATMYFQAFGKDPDASALASLFGLN